MVRPSTINAHMKAQQWCNLSDKEPHALNPSTNVVASTEVRHTQRDRFTTCSVVPMHTYFQLTFASPNAFHPCVLKLGVAGTSTPPKPSTADTATTAFAKLIGATLGTSGAHRTDNRRRGSCGKGA